MKNKPLIVYNLFPRHFKNICEWCEEVPRIAEMGFNAIFVNPFFETGSSNSLYAIKDYYKLNSLFLKDGEDPTNFTPIAVFNLKCKEYNIQLFIDLVINHTANESVLVQQHPEWYKWNNGNLIHPHAEENGVITAVWGDLASIDNEYCSNREALWSYWNNFIIFFQSLGICGFRCDAAYQVCPNLWKYLISNAKSRNSETIFLAETLGCDQDKINALSCAEFDYFFNSAKWWNYDKSWAIDQHSNNKGIAPSIAFPESHDTERLASEYPKTELAQKGKYAFASIFSKGILMLNGYEFGSTIKSDVVRGRPEDLNKQWDISKWIKKINNLKCSIPILSEEGNWYAISSYDQSYLFLKKMSNDYKSCMYVCINKQPIYDYIIKDWMIPEEVKRSKEMIQLVKDSIRKPMSFEFTLNPSDVVIFL
jgi:starch synthase (maltosyl-transferring)